MTTVGSLLTSSAGVMLGEVWPGILESLRIGNGDMSFRAASTGAAHAIATELQSNSGATTVPDS